MIIYVKVGTHSATKMEVARKRKLPVVGDIFDLREPGERWSAFTVRCCEIKDVYGEKLYFVERW